jgi:large subunit ribosomal protein L2
LTFPSVNSKLKRLGHVRPSTGGRGHSGSITIRHRGGRGRLRVLRLNYVRPPQVQIGLVTQVVRAGLNRPLVGLLNHGGGLCYIVLAHGLIVGSRSWSLPLPIISNGSVPIGIVSPIWGFRQGDSLFGLVSANGYAKKWARAAGTYNRVMHFSESYDFVIICLPSGAQAKVRLTDRGVAGRNSNVLSNMRVVGSAGSNRHLGKRPSVRGVAMNPVDHPHGGRTKTSKPEVSP